MVETGRQQPASDVTEATSIFYTGFDHNQYRGKLKQYLEDLYDLRICVFPLVFLISTDKMFNYCLCSAVKMCCSK